MNISASVCYHEDMPEVELKGDRDEFVREIVRRIEAVMLGTTLQTNRGCVPLTIDEKDRLERIASEQGLTSQELIDRYSD